MSPMHVTLKAGVRSDFSNENYKHYNIQFMTTTSGYYSEEFPKFYDDDRRQTMIINESFTYLVSRRPLRAEGPLELGSWYGVRG